MTLHCRTEDETLISVLTGMPPRGRGPASRTHRTATQDSRPSQTFPAGHVLIARGAPASDLVLIEAGEAEVVVGEGDSELVVGDLGPGEHAGLSQLLALAPAPIATVRTRGACRARLLSRQDLDCFPGGGAGLAATLATAALLQLVAHLDVVTADLLALPQLVPGPAHPDGERGPELSGSLSDSGLFPLIFSDLEVDRLPAGAIYFRRDAPGRLPDAWYVLHGWVRRFRRRPNGGEVELLPAVAGELGGFEACLGAPQLLDEIVAGEDAVIARIPGARCAAAMTGRAPVDEALRQAMGRSLALRLADARRQLVQVTAGTDTPLQLADIDQRLMLAATCRGTSGAV